MQRLLEWDEQIKIHLMWVWGGEAGFTKRGREGMLVITDRRIAFISKTNMTYRIHDVYSRRQRIRFQRNENVFRPIEDYSISELRADLDKDSINVNLEFKKMVKLDIERKRWGTTLMVEVSDEGKKKTYKFSIVKSWVKYPAKDPLQFEQIDWSPVVTLFRNST